MHATFLSPFVPQRLTMVMPQGAPPGLDRLASLATEGKIAFFIERPYPLAEAPDAVRRLAAGKATGKVVITV
jgi:NADPH:quinone reductase-like Zn-dependent oxidoreductase